MKKQLVNFSLVATVAFAAMLSLGSAVQAQSAPDAQQPQAQQPETPAPQTQPATPSTPAPQTPSQAQPSPAPDAAQPTAAPSPTAAGASQAFVGTVTKQGDKYLFQDAASGTVYDIDHQDEVKKYDGKRVKFHGTLDSATKTIHVQ